MKENMKNNQLSLLKDNDRIIVRILIFCNLVHKTGNITKREYRTVTFSISLGRILGSQSCHL